MPAPMPGDEAERLACLHRYGVLDTPPEVAFDRLARLAARILDVPVALISLVDADRQWFKACVGMDATSTPRDVGFCPYAILTDRVMVVHDARRDPRFAHDPFVTGPPAMRFYAGAPLRTPKGHRIGTICVVDRRPRRPDPPRLRMLADLAALAIDELELRREAAERGRAEAVLRAAIDNLPLHFWMRDREHRCVLQSPVARAQSGNLAGTVPEQSGLPPQVVARWREEGSRALAGETFRREVSEELADGETRIVDKIVAPVRGDAGMIGYLGVSIDVTEQRRVAAEARAALERTALALAAGRMGTWDWDVAADRVVWDEQECRLFGLRPGDPPPTGDAFFAIVHPEDRGALVEACERAARTGEGYEVEYRIGLPDGSVRWLAERCTVMRDEQDRLARVVGITYDVTDRGVQEERIRGLAMHDPLTGLPNRRTLREVLARELAQAARGWSGPALLLVDLDEFKRVSDPLGHAAGDELLVEVARRLLGCVRAGDVVARLGGDEFAIVAAGAGGTAGLTTMAERLGASLEAPVALRGVEVRAGASVGIAPDSAGVADPDELLARADLALYAAKEAGRSTWRFFRPTMRERARDDAALELDLRRAVERGELVLHYQPIVDAVSLEARSAEALIRWRHPERGLVPPGGFLPTAERNRMIVPLTYWVLDEALSQAAAWRAEGPGPLPVAVNVAIPALEADGLVRHVERRLAAHSLPPEALVVEVTEGAMADGRQAMATLAALRRLGVRVAIDDFGAGYSSLARLRDLPLDVLKIDRAFLAARGLKGEAILRAVVELGRSLGLPTVAEGVETAEQLGLLRRVGAGLAQGYLIARPMPAAELAAWPRSGAAGRLLGPCLDLLRRGALGAWPVASRRAEP